MAANTPPHIHTKHIQAISVIKSLKSEWRLSEDMEENSNLSDLPEEIVGEGLGPMDGIAEQ